MTGTATATWRGRQRQHDGDDNMMATATWWGRQHDGDGNMMGTATWRGRQHDGDGNMTGTATWWGRQGYAKMAWTADVYFVESWVTSADHAIFTCSCRPPSRDQCRAQGGRTPPITFFSFDNISKIQISNILPPDPPRWTRHTAARMYTPTPPPNVHILRTPLRVTCIEVRKLGELVKGEDSKYEHPFIKSWL